jgi:FemAB-related protein (PEP-CTERM system-associated)
MNSFKSKLRSQINKPLKEGLHSRVGGLELLEDFYSVFSVNMRDLGSPVHSKKLLELVLQNFSEDAKLIVVYKENQPLAGSLVFGFRDILENPWASAIKEYSRLSPNMLLYWAMLEYACKNGYSFFDFGRSSVDQGTYKFKEQWGAEPTPLHWHLFILNGHPITEELSEKAKFDKAIKYWKRLPVFTTRLIGPYIRKHISL